MKILIIATLLTGINIWLHERYPNLADELGMATWYYAPVLFFIHLFYKLKKKINGIL